MVATTSKGEVINVQEANQFQPGKSQFECGFFACAIARTMSRPDHPPTMSAAQVIANAEKWYAQYDGSDDISNTAGMTDEQEYELLKQIGLHFQAIDPDIKQVKAWVTWGYPVLIAVTETSVHDLGLDGACPYPWTPSGTHIILVTGIGAGDHVLVRDSANVTSLFDPNSLRPGPRLYDAKRLQVVSATVVVPPWRPRPASTTPPEADMQIPTDWSDDKTTLTAPNGQKVTGVFRTYILSHPWESTDVPLGPAQDANPVEIGWKQPDGNNAGSRLICMYSELCYTAKRGVYRASVGREFWTLLNQQGGQPVLSPPKTPTPGTTADGKEAANAAILQDLKAAARLIGDTGTHMLTQLNALQ